MLHVRPDVLDGPFSGYASCQNTAAESAPGRPIHSRRVRAKADGRVSKLDFNSRYTAQQASSAWWPVLDSDAPFNNATEPRHGSALWQVGALRM